MKVCVTCKRGPNFWEGCSRIECPQRKPITANSHTVFLNRTVAPTELIDGGSRKVPTDKE